MWLLVEESVCEAALEKYRTGAVRYRTYRIRGKAVLQRLWHSMDPSISGTKCTRSNLGKVPVPYQHCWGS